jgi:hypothetical protein
LAAYRDLEPLDYFGAVGSLRAVGWLERGVPFRTGDVDERVYQRLRELLTDVFQPFASGDYCGIELRPPVEIDALSPVRDWFLRWFRTEAEPVDGIVGAVHFISDPGITAQASRKAAAAPRTSSPGVL